MKRGRIVYVMAMAVCLLSVSLAMSNSSLQEKMNAGIQGKIAEKVLRFHVIANSDSRDDQEVKLRVRDAVGAMLEPKLKDAKSLQESKLIVTENQKEIVAVVRHTLKEAGYAYGAEAVLDKVTFPEKTYGEYTFPEGDYEALEIILGEGKGHNWWCVLYPNMCFQGSVYEVVEEDAKQKLREVLSPAEYVKVFDKEHLRVKWKFLEYFRKNS